MRIHVSIHHDRRSKSDYWPLVCRINYTENGHNKSSKATAGITVPKKDWDERRKKVKGLDPISKRIETRIREIEDYGNSLNLETAAENLTALRNYISNTGGHQEVVVSLRDFIDRFIRVNESGYSENTIRKYRTLKNIITDFCKETKRHDNIPTMNEDQQIMFFSDWSRDMIERGLSNVTIKTVFKRVKSVATLFKELGLKIQLSQFTRNLREGNTEKTFCTPHEVDVILEKSETLFKNELEDKAVDTFIWQLHTGCRHQDLYHVTDDNLIHRMVHGTSLTIWKYVTNKKGKEREVALTPRCTEILKKWKEKPFRVPKLSGVSYDKCLLPVLNVSDANQHLHTFLKRIDEFKRMENTVYYSGKDRKEEQKARWENITTHSARHSYSHKLNVAGFSKEKTGLMLGNDAATADKYYKHYESNDVLFEALKVIGG